MQCDICERDSSHICCSACARHTLWPMRYDTLLRTSEKAAVEENINAYLTAELSEGVQSGSKVLPVAAGKEIKLLRAQIDEAKLTIAKVMGENEKMKAEITEGAYSSYVAFGVKLT